MSKDARNDAAVIRAAARSVASDAAYDPLVELAGEAQCVLIGEPSHGTHEFYETRAQLTKRLVQEKGFRAVALEADWPDTFRVFSMRRGFRAFGSTCASAMKRAICCAASGWRARSVSSTVPKLSA